MYGPLFCSSPAGSDAKDYTGPTAMWVAGCREDFAQHVRDIKANGERYRIVERTISALGGSVTVAVLCVFPLAKDQAGAKSFAGKFLT